MDIKQKYVMRMNIAFITATCLLLNVCVCAGADNDYVTRGKMSMQRGLDWLKGLQREDGSWSNINYPAMTALGLWAFTRSNDPDKDKICAKAARFVAGFAQADGGIYKPATSGRGSGGLSTYNTAICMIALHTYDKAKYAPIILKAREFIAHSQLVGDSPDSGGFGYDAKPVGSPGRGSPARADLSNTGWALQSMRVTQDLEDRRQGERVDVNWEAALAFAERMQNQEENDPVNYGGFGYTPGAERGGTDLDKKSGAVKLRGFGSMTYAGLEAMIYARVDRKDPRVRSALLWASRHWSVDENPGMGDSGLFYYYNIMGKALHVSGTDMIKRESGGVINWKKDIVEKLAAIQMPDGSWINKNNQFWEGDSVLVTTYSVLTLEYAFGM
ncbi:MAG: terpene cyclase/mutase family protein [Lentisphaerae bacterium]|nr:terpene cyclase/mutase family protein [Lentisphaerota bacterium]